MNIGANKCVDLVKVAREMRHFAELVPIVARADNHRWHINLVSVLEVLLLYLDGAPDNDEVAV